MAEAILGSLLLKIGAILAPEVAKSLWSLTTEEVSLLTSVENEMTQMKAELEMMMAFIKDVDRVSEYNERTAGWVKQVREVAYEAEDIIDGFTYFLEGRKKSGLLNCLAKSRNIRVWHEMKNKIKNMKNKIKNISEMKDRYDVKGLGEGSSATDSRDAQLHHEDPCLFFREDYDLVGMESSKRELIDWLMDGKEERIKISVCGMGGLGKTTLAAQVYKSEVTKQHFECRAWITVSSTYNTYKIDDMLKRIIKELLVEKKETVPHGIDTMDRRRLAEMLHQLLEQKRYLIVFDDVWSADVWAEMRLLFPDNKCQSRVMFTTRNQEIADSLASPSRIFDLKPLQYDQGWELFSKITFRGDRGGVCPPYLENSANAIVKKCDGLPLAVVTLGGVLYSKHLVSEWNTVINNLDGMFTSNPQLGKISNILMISYYDLPHHLKNCFLHCSAFPEDYLIGRKRIIRSWVAEGFVEQRKEVTVEEVAEQYLNKLVHRSMLQIAEKNRWGQVKKYRMHDIVREVAISISKKINFCMTLEEQPSTGVRRLSVAKVNNTIQEELGKMSHLRSLLMFATDDLLSCSFNRKTSLEFKLLRVMDLEDAPIDSIPDAVGDLFNLRYLGLRKTKVKVLPKRLKRLQNLQTLNLAYSNVKEIPNGVTKLPNLRHLILRKYGFILFVTMKTKTKHTWAFKKLQTLKGISSNSEVVRRVGDLTQLRSFAIGEVRESDGTELCASIKNMIFLHDLNIQSADGGEAPLKLENLDPPPPLLQKLYLRGRLQGTLPRWFNSLKNLKTLNLMSSGLKEDPLLSLKSLPNLVWLTLYNAYDGEDLCFQAGGFPSLKELGLAKLSHLNQITIEEGAMQSLKEFNLASCKELKTLPQGIERLTTLQELNLWGMAEELLERMRGEQAVDRQKISHIPIVKHTDESWNTESFS